MARPGRVAGFVAVSLLSCTRVTPSQEPLSPVQKPVARVERPSSSRAYEGMPSEEREEIEITVQPSDDDDDDSARAASSAGVVSSSTKPGTAKGVSPKPGATCSVGAGAPPDCGQLPSGTSCLGASLAQRTCETVGGAVDPNVGAAWLRCMRDPAHGSPCDSQRIVACGLRAASGACVDGSYHELCREISAACRDMASEITAPVCEQLIAAWKPERRSQMIECLRHGCETGGFGVCLP